jgi:hypothetical protein
LEVARAAATAGAKRHSFQEAMIRRKLTMSEQDNESWQELCSAAVEARDPGQLLRIVQQLNQALQREEQVGRDFRECRRSNQAVGSGPVT